MTSISSSSRLFRSIALFVVLLTVTLLGSTVYRPYVYSHHINDGHLADFWPNLMSIPVGYAFMRVFYVYSLNSAVFFLVRKFYMLRCLFGTLYVDMRCFGVSCFFSKHKIPHPNQWGILKPQRNTVYSRKTSE